jgi:hypothetical protein
VLGKVLYRLGVCNGGVTDNYATPPIGPEEGLVRL